jgi:hypothetical protein
LPSSSVRLQKGWSYTSTSPLWLAWHVMVWSSCLLKSV